VEEESATDFRWVTVLLVLPNVGIFGVWVFTVANEWYLYTPESIPLYSLTMCGGGPVSLFGLMVSVIGLRAGRPSDHRWWWTSFAANGFGMFVNCAGFLGYMAPGC
jgi:hypothetical protein